MMDLSLFKCKQKFLVHFDECDPAGVVHNSSYIKYFERSRTTLIHSLGLKWNVECFGEDYYLVVGENYCKYLMAARYDEELTIYVRITDIKRCTCRFEYIIMRETDNKRICEGYTTLVKTTADYSKAKQFTKKFKELIEP